MKQTDIETDIRQQKSEKVAPPSKHLMALLTFIALLPLVYFIPPFVGTYIDSHLLVTVISVGIIVPIITYGMLPIMLNLMLKIYRKK